MKNKYLRVANIFSYISAGIYAVITSLFFSISFNIYWMFLIFGLVSLVSGLYSETIIFNLKKDNKLTKKDFISLIVITCLSIISPLSFLFNLLALLIKKESLTKIVFNEDFVEEVKKEKKWYLKSSFIVLVVSLCGILFSSISGHLFETSGGSVAVQDGTIGKK